MHKRVLFLVFSVTLILSSCKKEVFLLNEDVSIGFNSTILVETMDNGQMDVQYVELLEESRCPPDEYCVWAGYVKVKLKLDDEQYVELGLGETTIDSVVYNNHIIKLLSVEYDSDDDFGEENKSSVVIRVD
ncbi:MAG: hypothetical protein HRT58_03670 [Crocinitomicaceae bacterium]|nr:hypothetical protein [Flavobacteriales bacterium]NQZ34732.1 hypothetical protein [Crocinitomicaceae bacterium]